MPDIVALLNAIDSFAEQSHGSDTDGGELSRQRALALDAYQGKILDEAPEGRSQVGDRAVFETVQWIMPSMMRIFASEGDNVVEFDPTDENDEEVAEQESDYLNYLVMQKGEWELTVREWIQDALITKNAYCLVEMRERLDPEVDRYEGQSEEQVALLLQDKGLEVVGQRQYDDPEGQQGKLLDPYTGEPIDPNDQASMMGAMVLYQDAGIEPEYQPKQLFDIDVKRIKAEKKLVFDVLPPEQCRIAENTKDFTLADCDYFEIWGDKSISELRRLGYEVEDDIADDGGPDTQEGDSRDEEYEIDDEFEHADPSMRMVNCRTIWVRYDYDEDGIAELQRVVRVGQEILSHEPATRIPVACIVPYINTHRHIGTSIADLTFDIQRIKTSLLRAGLDSLQLANNPRHAVSDKVTLDDMLVSRPGGLVRLKKGAIPGEGHVMPLPTENTFPYAQQGLLHMDTVTEARVGVNKMFQGIDQSAMGGQNAYNAVGQLSTMAAQRVEDVARLFGTGFKRLFSLAHEAIIKSGHQAETAKLRGKWVNIDPSQWKTGRDMRVTAPFSAGNKDSLVQRIMVHLGVHEKALAAGLPIVDVNNAYNLALELAKATDMAGNKIYTDPSTVEPAPPPPDYTAMALEIENKKADNQAADSQVDAEIDKYKADLDAQVKQYQVDANAQLQLALANIKAGNSVDLEKVKAKLKINPIEYEGAQMEVSDVFNTATNKMNAMLQKTVKTLQDIIAEQNEPKRVVRDKKGKVIGIESSKGMRKIVRDDKGKVTGVE